MSLRRYFGSMAGRLFVFLLIGVIGAASLALTMANARRATDLQRIRVERIADRMGVFLTLVDNASGPFREQLLDKGVPGIKRASGHETILGEDERMERGLTPRIKTLVRAERANISSCFAPSVVSPFYDSFDCWVFTAKLTDGETVRLQAKGPRDIDGSFKMAPLFLTVLAGGIATIAFFSARMAAAPLRDLSRAASALGGDLDRVPLPERGPTEVREAVAAFNAMQVRLRDYVVERTQMLASITHDLQTPMTRMRLRLEKIEDQALRSRLIDEWDGMQVLIREGLDYARSNQTDEPFGHLALDDLLEIVTEDAAEGGKSVRLVRRSSCDIQARPRALQRCLANLIDNAIKYGGSAEVSAEQIGDRVVVTVRDHGPGIPDGQIEQATKPFARLDAHAGVDGVGLGLTIAKTLAEKNDAQLILANHIDGGLEAKVVLFKGVVAVKPPPARRRSAKTKAVSAPATSAI